MLPYPLIHNINKLQPEAVKKRKALAMCKDSSALSSSGYTSASQCSNAVLQGNYESIMEGAAKGGTYVFALFFVLIHFFY